MSITLVNKGSLGAYFFRSSLFFFFEELSNLEVGKKVKEKLKNDAS